MSKIQFKTKLDEWAIRFLLTLVAATILLIPFHATLTIWLSQIFGHYTALRLWKEVLLLIEIVLAAYLAYRNPKLWAKLAANKLVWLIVIYASLTILVADISYARHGVSAKAMAYGVLVNLRFLAFFIVCWIAAELSGILKLWWKWLLLLPAAVVVVFGLLQHFLLPYDFLKHLGYDVNKNISPYETIDKKLSYIRIESTLRGANPLGAYMVVVSTALAGLIMRSVRLVQVKLAVFLAASIVVLFYSYSRSAWIGAALSISLIFWLSIRSGKTRILSGAGVLILLMLMLVSFALFRHNDQFQNTFFHTDEHSTSSQSSNYGHKAALKNGLLDMVHNPLGSGPGTAGPASFYNTNHAPRIAENYYVQIGQEIGWLGMALFVLINIVVARMLWLRRQDTLALILLASLAGLTLINLLSHAWTDDTLAYMWWGFAGIAMAGEAVGKHGKTRQKHIK